MEKRRVTISIGGQPCSFYSDDSDEYISELEQRVNAAIRLTAGNTVRSVILLTDQLMRMEQAAAPEAVDRQKQTEKQEQTEAPVKREPVRKKAAKTDEGQVSVWDLLGDQ